MLGLGPDRSRTWRKHYAKLPHIQLDKLLFSALPNETPESEKDQKDCEAEYAGPCGSVVGSARECIFRNIKCNASGLRTNDSLSTIETACEAPLRAYRACSEQNNSTSNGR